MSEQAISGAHKAVDSIQQRLSSYAFELRYEDLSPSAVHAVKVRFLDTLGALFAGFFGEPCRIARDLAATMPNAGGATVIGTRMRTTPDMAAFANAIASRYVELNDAYHRPGVMAGHPSDVVMSVLAAADHVHARGRDLITAIALAYEVHLRMIETIALEGFDYTNFICMGAATAAGKLLGLSQQQLAHCISMAVVPNNALLQSRMGHLSMFKAAAAGQAGRAGVFAALLARAGMEGPHLPFEGKAGWCDHVARKRITLDVMGGKGTSFKVEETMVKWRSCCGTGVSSVLAAEKVASRMSIKDIGGVTLEVYRKAKQNNGTGEQHWNPSSRESADHSLPYLVAAVLLDGTITPRSFDAAHLGNADLRALMQRIEVVENPEFTLAFESHPPMERARVTVVSASGERMVGEAGGGPDDLSVPKSDAKVEQKFRGLAEDLLGVKRVDAIVERIWHLEEIEDVAAMPPAFVIV